MARKSSSTAVQEELYPAREYDARDDEPSRRHSSRESFDDARVIDLEEEQQSPFLRGQKRVSVRRGSIPKKTANWLKWSALALVVLGIFTAIGAELYSYGKHNWRFRIDSSDQIEVTGAQHVPRAQIMEVMGGDIGRNIFFVPLDHRKEQLEQIPWVESASVMRFVPNRLRIEIHERTPVAFARIGSHISLIDAHGNLMDLEPGPKHKYSFPVITGMNAGEPLSMRASRMKGYNELIQQLDYSGAHYSQDLSEVDLSDPEDVKVVTADPNSEVLVHLGTANFLQRYRVYVTHVEGWRQQFEKLESVDLRFDGQIIVNPDLQGISRQPALSQTAAKAALAAGVKHAAIVNYEKYVNRPAPAAGNKAAAKSKPATKTATNEAKVAAKDASKTTTKRTTHRAKSGAKTKPVGSKPAHASAKAAPPATKPSSSSTASSSPTKSQARSAGPASGQDTTPKPVPSAPSTNSTAAAHKKPSALIAKEPPQN
ncbi:MAG TPA: FtsQ-type POTRA domain-containing protein [Terriglobales bacterium]|nr:FtsQ-type POTRA domain-containing protein [Terriglobales bacterium]